MDTPAERLHEVVRQHFPFAYCYPCLATQLGLVEEEVRDAAQSIIVDGRLVLERRVCQRCHRTGDFLTLPPGS